MTERSPNGSQVILSTAERFRSLGYRETREGVRLFGPVPHIAAEAWFHALPRGLLPREISEIERTVGIALTATYAELLQEMNGAHLFHALHLYGARPNFSRADREAAFLPFDIRPPNDQEKPRSLNPMTIVIGGYSRDGSMVAMDTSNGKVLRVDRHSGQGLNSWPSLDDFLNRELRRLNSLFDDDGKLRVAREMLLPQGYQ